MLIMLMELLDGKEGGWGLCLEWLMEGSYLILTLQVLSEFCVCLFPFSILITLLWNILLFGLNPMDVV